jgi:hypothetical protein
MPDYQLPHHRLIMAALAQFDADFFTPHGICKALLKSLQDMQARPALYLERAADMKMKPDWAQRIVMEGAQQLHKNQSTP